MYELMEIIYSWTRRTFNLYDDNSYLRDRYFKFITLLEWDITFNEWIRLRDINLKGLHLESLPFSIFPDDCRSITIEESVIRDLEIDGYFPALKTLNAENIGLRSIRGLKNLPRITKLDISLNNISWLEWLSLPKTMSILNLSNNPIRKIEGFPNHFTCSGLFANDTYLNELSLPTDGYIQILDVRNTRIANCSGGAVGTILTTSKANYESLK